MLMTQETTSSNNKRIAKNTAMLYVRMLLTMAVSLYTSRVVLRILGVEDFGIYNVVAGVVTMFSFLNSSMAISVQRFLSFSLGEEKQEGRVDLVYSVSFYIHLLIAIILLAISECVSSHLVDSLNIPVERQEAAHTIFHISILTTCVSVVQIPFTGLIIATEKMDAYAYISIVEVVLRLGIVFLLPILPFDRLESYACLLLCSSSVILITYGLYCRIVIRSVRLRCIWDRHLFKRMLSFASYSMFGEIAWTAVGQGVSIVLNIFFSPVINASRAIAMQVSVAIKRFVDNFQMALNPQIIKLYASGNKEEMLRLCFRGTRLSLYLLMLIAMPFVFCANHVIRLWLGTVPDSSVSFCVLALCGFLFDVMSNLLATVVKATGNIRVYQLVVSLFLFLNLPLSYACLMMGFPPESVYWVYCGVSFALLFVRLYLLRPMVGLSIRAYCDEVLFPVGKVSVLAVIVPVSLYSQLEQNVFTSAILSLISFVLLSIIIYKKGLDIREKQFIKQKIQSFVCKLN